MCGTCGKSTISHYTISIVSKAGALDASIANLTYICVFRDSIIYSKLYTAFVVKCFFMWKNMLTSTHWFKTIMLHIIPNLSQIL